MINNNVQFYRPIQLLIIYIGPGSIERNCLFYYNNKAAFSPINSVFFYGVIYLKTRNIRREKNHLPIKLLAVTNIQHPNRIAVVSL